MGFQLSPPDLELGRMKLELAAQLLPPVDHDTEQALGGLASLQVVEGVSAGVAVGITRVSRGLDFEKT